MIKSGTVILLVALCSWTLVEGFNFDRDVLSHFRSKRADALKRVCASELYSAPLNTICKTPAFVAHTAAVGKCLATLKMKSLADGEPVCAFDCAYQANKWASAAGALDLKKIDADFVKGVNDKTWAPIVQAAIKKCGAVAASSAAAKLASGYVTKCKVTSYVAQTCIMTELYGGCPATAKAASYNAGKTALMACDATAMFKTPADLAKGAMGALKGFDTKALAGADPKAVISKLPPAIAAMLPKNLDLAAVKANPAAFVGKVPPAVLAMLG